MENKQEMQFVKYDLNSINMVLELLEAIQVNGFSQIDAMNNIFKIITSQGIVYAENAIDNHDDNKEIPISEEEI